jgi:hypothetical protein
MKKKIWRYLFRKAGSPFQFDEVAIDQLATRPEFLAEYCQLTGEKKADWEQQTRYAVEIYQTAPNRGFVIAASPSEANKQLHSCLCLGILSDSLYFKNISKKQGGENA